MRFAMAAKAGFSERAWSEIINAEQVDSNGNGIGVARSFAVVSNRMIGGWITGTSAM